MIPRMPTVFLQRTSCGVLQSAAPRTSAADSRSDCMEAHYVFFQELLIPADGKIPMPLFMYRVQAAGLPDCLVVRPEDKTSCGWRRKTALISLNGL